MKTSTEKRLQSIELQNAHIYEKMMASPFTFFRANNQLFWEKYANDERLKKFSNNNKTWIQGDLHVYNFGIFHNQQNKTIYNINDFDETIIADYQYDLWRFAASVLLACKSETELSNKKQKKIVSAFSKYYLEAMYRIINGNKKQMEFITADLSKGILKDELKHTKRKNSRKQLLNKWTHNVKGKRKFDVSLEKLTELTPDRFDEISASMQNYIQTFEIKQQFGDSHFKIKDIAQRLLSGLGSFGVPRYYVLLEGEDKKVDDDILLDVKWQSKPTAYGFMDEKFQQNYDENFVNEGQRFVQSYRDMIKYDDPYLGWMQLSDGVYAVREISPYKSYIAIEDLTKKKDYMLMVKYWAQIIASYHGLSYKGFDRKQFYKMTSENPLGFEKLVYETAQEFATETQKEWKLFEATVD